MADITVYKPAAVTVSVIDGDPPVDQTALVASLQASIANAQTAVTNAQTAATALQAALSAAQAALA